MNGEPFTRKHPGQDPLAFLVDMDGLRLAGGCQDCDAYQTVDASLAPIYRITVHHDGTCPSYLAMGETEAPRR